MKIIAVINYSRSGGTLLARILGSLPKTIVLSEINPAFGASPDNLLVKPGVAIGQQMLKWYNFDIGAEDFHQGIAAAQNICFKNGKNLIVRDWTHLDFSRSILNNFQPSRRLTIIEELSKKHKIQAMAFVRDAIDVYLSVGGNLKDFSQDYLTYVKAIKIAQIPIIKYENLIDAPKTIVKSICGITDIEYSDDFLCFGSNNKVTGDIQVCGGSRGTRAAKITRLKRKWLPKSKQTAIENDKNMTEANCMLGYSTSYCNGNTEKFMEMLVRRLVNKLHQIATKLESLRRL